MGKPMVGHLLAGGHELSVFARRGAPEELTSKGARACESAREVAEKSDVIITMVPDTSDVEAMQKRPSVASVLARRRRLSKQRPVPES